MAAAGQRRGFEALRQENRAIWADLWKGRVLLDGAATRWQAFTDAAYFYLHSSVHPSSPSSTSLFGLAQWHNYHYYRGHVMWDIETFCVPPVLLTNPAAARAMLDYRSERLSAARQNARLNGYLGLQFPWESSPLMGEEAAPADAAAAQFEHHVSMDVAFAFAQFAHATGDQEFTSHQAWQVLKGVAEWIESRAIRTGRGYEIHGVTGVAEKKNPVDNNAFVNMSAIVVLREAAALAKRLNKPVPAGWLNIADRLLVPVDERSNVILNHDRYDPNEEKGETPEALAGLFPYGYQPGAAVEEATLAFYLDLAPKYVGAPMLSALLGVWAARLGHRERSMDLFERGFGDFILEPFTQADEYAASVFPEQPRAGPMFANLGGFLTGCLFGLTGLSLGPDKPSTWCQRPVTMPAGWDGVEVERIWVRGRPARFIARQGAAQAEILLEAE
jgi:hypothetical protein